MQQRNSAQPPPDDVDLLRLSATPGCTEEQIKLAYRKQAQRLHPDHGGDAERFRQLQRDYEVALKRLREPILRPATNARYVPTAPVRRRSRKRLYRRAAIILVIMSMVAMLLPHNTRIILLVTLPALGVLLVLPMLLSSLKPHISGILFLLTTPLLIVLIFGISLNGRFGAVFSSEHAAQTGDFVLLAIVALSASLLAAIFLGLLFSLSND